MDDFFYCFFFCSLSGSDYLSTIDTDELYQFISRYKFIISYENSVCNDYVTEKIWRTLIVGSVPVYFGAPNIKVGRTLAFQKKDLIPVNKNSVVQPKHSREINEQTKYLFAFMALLFLSR